MIGLDPIELATHFIADGIGMVYLRLDRSRIDLGQLLQHGAELPVDIQRSVHTRRVEYLAGRYCARQALGQLGAATWAVGRKADGAPDWPEGVLGSLSHTEERVIACVAWQSEWSGLGIDIEKIVGTEMLLSLEHLVFTQTDKLQMQASHLNLLETATLIFSAKEAFYKFIHPQTSARLDFKDVSLQALDSDGFTIELHKDLGAPWRKGRRVRGSYLFESNHVITLIAKSRTHPDS
ncbi:4'-phosphopantetheinyl transferase [Pseudomonas sp. RW409]|uniref:4'-phosphopantetheinyl transferase family protein n=1 Tax=Pseudomonas sp. RW409 TaxID=2202895 RepID=UPI000D7376BE|nr:4'-phosphopantetheinyl transferase superfamily protein [Pseudomonas sp. RW409]PWY48748.1 ACP synthase [Pseudomonas sp. RW409]